MASATGVNRELFVIRNIPDTKASIRNQEWGVWHLGSVTMYIGSSITEFINSLASCWSLHCNLVSSKEIK
jgi:hypothetical protein